MSPKASDPAPGTRERLLDTAERLFAGRGFAGTSVREITEVAEANLAAVNYHFRSKENLYSEVFARRVALLREPILAAAREAAGLARKSPDEALRALGRAFLAPHEDKNASARMLGLFARETIEANLPRGLLVREFLVPTIEAITRVVRQTRPALPEITARACAHAFLAQLMHIVRAGGVLATSADEQLEHAVRFTVAAVRHMESPSRKRSRSKTPRK